MVIVGHSLIQNLRRAGDYEFGLDAPCARRMAVAFTALAQAI
jgi:hypothetical protein